MFLPYASAFLVIFLCYCLPANLLALQAFNRKAYAYPFHEAEADTYVLYFSVTMKLFFANSWSQVRSADQTMYSCIQQYGFGVSLYFLALALLSKFVLENCFISIFIFIYSENYWQYIKEDSTKIVLEFEKSSYEKRTYVSRSIFFPHLNRPEEPPKDDYLEDEIGSNLDRKNSQVATREAQAFMKFANAVKFTKNVRLRKRQGPISNLQSKDSLRSRESIFQVHRESSLRKSTTTKRVKGDPISRLREEFLKDRDDKGKSGSIDYGQPSKQAYVSTGFSSQATVYSPKNIFSPTSTRMKLNQVLPSGKLKSNTANLTRGDSMMPYRAAVSKLKMIRSANLFKEIITQKSHNKFLSFFKTKMSVQTSVFFSGLSVLAVTLTTKRIICSESPQRWAAIMFFWFCNIYFSFEFFSLVGVCSSRDT